MSDLKCDIAIVGGGTAGMETAGLLADQGYKVVLLEKEETTGGHLNDWHHLFPDRRKGTEVITYLDNKIKKDNLQLLTGSRVDKIEKNKKNKKSFIIKTSKGKDIDALAVVIATGFDLYKSERKEEYGYGIYDNVITSLDLEKKFRNASIKMSNGEIPKKIGIIHCVGSRDAKAGNLYCSKLCCVTAVKQAIELREYIPESRVYCFYMDMRMGGALYEELYMKSQEVYGVNYIRGKVSEVSVTFDHNLVIKVEDTLVGRPLRMELDMLVLMAGMEISSGSKKLGESLGLKTGENRFFQGMDNHFGSNLSNVSGIFYAGSCTAPMNITETISHARASVFEIIDYLKDVRK